MIVVLAVLGLAATAHAERKRVVVLDFEGPRAEKFHDDLVRLIAKSHTVVPTDRWNGAAQELGAAGVSQGNIKKVAKKLKVDAVIEGRIEKRREAFLIRLKLHDGKSGGMIGNPIDTRADGPRIDGRAQREIKDELVDALDAVAGSYAGVAEEAEEPRAGKRPGKKPAPEPEDDEIGIVDDEDEPPVKPAGKKPELRSEPKESKEPKERDEARPARPVKPADPDEDDEAARPSRRGFGRLSGDQRGVDRVDRASAEAAEAGDSDGERRTRRGERGDGDDERDAPGDDDSPRRASRSDTRRSGKRVAARDGERADGEVEAKATRLSPEAAVAPGERALDAVVGVSATMRRMSFAFRRDLAARPASYKGTPVAGAMVDVTLYPLAFGHDRSDVMKNLGINVMYDRVLLIKSQDVMTGMTLSTKESRYRVGGVLRHALWDSPSALVVMGTLSYSSHLFRIAGMTDTPSVKYTILEPGGGVRLPLFSGLLVGLDARVSIVTDAGDISTPAQYGETSAIGFEGALAIDYQITRNVFARASLRAQTLRLRFDGDGERAVNRDNDPETQDVSGARDTFLGGALTAGYVF